jgi:diaminopimelate decarboxylase
MAEKKLPFTQTRLEEIIRQYPTPFHIYDEDAIRKNARQLIAAFSWAPQFKEYFAVKATPNPSLLRILREEGIWPSW